MPVCIRAATESSVSLEAFEGYRDGWQIGSFKKVFIEEVPSPERRSTYMQEGKADIVFFPDLQQAAVPGNVPDGYGLEMTGS